MPTREGTRASAPLLVPFVGLGIWWALGLAAFIPLLVGVVLAVQLARRRGALHLPTGLSAWLLFLVWVLLGAFLLGADAPGAAPGGDGFGRALVFGYRTAWYAACTVFLIWLGNTSRARLPDRTVYGAVTSLFVIATAGGLLGVLMPELEFRSAFQYVLPKGISSNSFVLSLVHPEAADIQSVLGRDEARPKAPFSFTNTWGAVIALSLPFAVAWAARRGWPSRVFVCVVAAVAAVPIAYSLNRGLWICLSLSAFGVVLLAIRRGKATQLVTIGLAGVLVAAIVAAPLISLVQERLDHQHSNERRGQLASATLDSVTDGSPLVGFGTTRDVQGSFASISGGSTPQCPACGVPPLGTQGHFWLVLFSQGWVGLLLFLSFLGVSLSRSFRCRTLNETVATFVLACFAVQLFVYDTLGLPFLLVMLAIGLVWREQLETRTGGAAWTTPQLAERVRAGAPLAVGLIVLGAVLGHQLAPDRDQREFSTRVQLALTAPPATFSPDVIQEVIDAPDLASREKPLTIDTEAALLLSERTLSRAVTQLDASDSISTRSLRDNVRLTAEPNTQVLVITVRADQPETSEARALAVSNAYLEARQDHLDRRRNTLLAQLHADLQAVLPSDPSTATLVLRLNAADRRLRSTTLSVGRVVRVQQTEAVPPALAVSTVSGAAIGLLGAVVVGSLLRRRGNRHERKAR